MLDLTGFYFRFGSEIQDGCHKVRRPVPKFLRGGHSVASRGSAVAPMTGTIVKVNERANNVKRRD